MAYDGMLLASWQGVLAQGDSSSCEKDPCGRDLIVKMCVSMCVCVDHVCVKRWDAAELSIINP